MLMAHPAVLRNLVEQYETLLILRAERGSVSSRRRLEDLSYTLCVSTGTRDVDTALQGARQHLGEASVSDSAVAV